MQQIYLDNAATAFPKAPGVSDAMKYYLDAVGANINRSVYGRAQEAGLTTLKLREQLKEFFSFPEKATHVLLTPGNTAGLNMVIKGLLHPGDHVLVSSMEHNAVMRPLLQLQGVSFDRIPCNREGYLDPDAAATLVRPNTRLCICAHASNVSGTVQNAAALGKRMQEAGVPFLLDAAQSTGHIPVHFQELKLSALSVPGHKGLLGPGGVGALLLTDTLAQRLDPLIAGGTGSASDSEYLPPYLPDRFESGTPNLPGYYGLSAALSFIKEKGLSALMAHEEALTRQFLTGLKAIPGVMVVGPQGMENRVGVISLDFPGRDNAEVADVLEQQFGILTRCGLHCAPSAHKTLGTFPRGTVRFSLGYANTAEEVDTALNAVEAMAHV